MSVPTPGTSDVVGAASASAERAEHRSDDERHKTNALGMYAESGRDFGIVRYRDDLLANPRVAQCVLEQGVDQKRDKRNEQQLIRGVGDAEQFDRAEAIHDFARRVGRAAPNQMLHVFEDQESTEGDEQLQNGVFVLNVPQQTDL